MSFEVPDDIFAMFQADSNCIFGLKLKKTALHNHMGSVCVGVVCVEDTLIFSYIRRLGSFFGVQNFEFQYF